MRTVQLTLIENWRASLIELQHITGIVSRTSREASFAAVEKIGGPHQFHVTQPFAAKHESSTQLEPE